MMAYRSTAMETNELTDFPVKEMLQSSRQCKGSKQRIRYCGLSILKECLVYTPDHNMLE